MAIYIYIFFFLIPTSIAILTTLGRYGHKNIKIFLPANRKEWRLLASTHTCPMDAANIAIHHIHPPIHPWCCIAFRSQIPGPSVAIQTRTVNRPLSCSSLSQHCTPPDVSEQRTPNNTKKRQIVATFIPSIGNLICGSEFTGFPIQPLTLFLWRKASSLLHNSTKFVVSNKPRKPVHLFGSHSTHPKPQTMQSSTIDYSKWDALAAAEDSDDDDRTAPMSERDIVAQDAVTIPQCRREAKEAVQDGKFQKALRLYTTAIKKAHDSIAKVCLGLDFGSCETRVLFGLCIVTSHKSTSSIRRCFLNQRS